jgi:hypothetical protein
VPYSVCALRSSPKQYCSSQRLASWTMCSIAVMRMCRLRTLGRTNSGASLREPLSVAAGLLHEGVVNSRSLQRHLAFYLQIATF